MSKTTMESKGGELKDFVTVLKAGGSDCGIIVPDDNCCSVPGRSDLVVVESSLSHMKCSMDVKPGSHLKLKYYDIMHLKYIPSSGMDMQDYYDWFPGVNNYIDHVSNTKKEVDIVLQSCMGVRKNTFRSRMPCYYNGTMLNVDVIKDDASLALYGTKRAIDGVLTQPISVEDRTSRVQKVISWFRLSEQDVKDYALEQRKSALSGRFRTIGICPTMWSDIMNAVSCGNLTGVFPTFKGIATPFPIMAEPNSSAHLYFKRYLQGAMSPVQSDLSDDYIRSKIGIIEEIGNYDDKVFDLKSGIELCTQFYNAFVFYCELCTLLCELLNMGFISMEDDTPSLYMKHLLILLGNRQNKMFIEEDDRITAIVGGPFTARRFHISVGLQQAALCVLDKYDPFMLQEYCPTALYSDDRSDIYLIDLGSRYNDGVEKYTGMVHPKTLAIYLKDGSACPSTEDYIHAVQYAVNNGLYTLAPDGQYDVTVHAHLKGDKPHGRICLGPKYDVCFGNMVFSITSTIMDLVTNFCHRLFTSINQEDNQLPLGSLMQPIDFKGIYVGSMWPVWIILGAFQVFTYYPILPMKAKMLLQAATPMKQGQGYLTTTLYSIYSHLYEVSEAILSSTELGISLLPHLRKASLNNKYYPFSPLRWEDNPHNVLYPFIHQYHPIIVRRKVAPISVQSLP